jgi:ABC-type bacteriocin/lantibiotic exporter with double-glycine peptidase domain
VISRPSSLLLPIVIMLSSGCAMLHVETIENDVPFHASIKDLCGVVALQAVLEYHEVEFEFDWLKKEAYSPFLKGSPPSILAETARKLGLVSSVEEGDFEKLSMWVAAGDVPILYLGGKSTSERGHFVVVTGMRADRKGVRIHAVDKPNRWYSYRTIKKGWAAGEYTAVLISKPKKDGK